MRKSCSRKYPKMFKTDSFLGNKKLSLNQNSVHATKYATGCFVAFLGDISISKSGKNIKKLFCCPALCPHLIRKRSTRP